MKIINDLKTITEPLKNPIITIGNFDGVHKGHQALISATIKKAKEMDGTSLVMTFEPHPAKVLNKKAHPPLITMYKQKVELLEQAGIDVLLCIPFTEAFGEITADSFVKDILVQQIGIKAIIMGKDYSFGKNREGNIDLLKRYAKEFNFDVIEVGWEKITGMTAGRISSTRIREIVMAGQVEQVPDFLGRHYQIRGKVVTGRNRGGKLLGFPTANINLYDELSPKTGVYAVTVLYKKKQYHGVANIGYSPTFDDHLFTVEVHILDFAEDIYGEIIRVNFITRLRSEKKFANIDELSDQINKDITKARGILSNI